MSSKKKFLENFSYLSILQLFNIAVPLITYRHVINTVGAGKYGMIVYASAIIAFFYVIINWGLNTSGVKVIALNRDDPIKTKESIYSIYIIKLFIFLICIIVYFILIGFISPNIEQKNIYKITFISCLRELLFPVWYFQGKEKMKYIAIINIIIRLLTIPMILIFIKSEYHIYRVAWINNISLAITGISGFIILLRIERGKIFQKKIPAENIRNLLKESTHFLLGDLTLALTQRSGVLIIGNYIGLKEASYFDFVKRLIDMFNQIVSNNINNALYPYIIRTSNKRRIISLILKGVILCIPIYIVFGLSSKIIIFILASEAMLPAQILFWVQGLMIPLAFSAPLLGSLLISANKENKYFYSLLISSFFYIGSIALFIGTDIVNIYTISLCSIISVLSQVIYRMLKVWEK